MKQYATQHVVKLSYEALIALLQGKDLAIQYVDFDTQEVKQIVIKPPFDGRFLTHQEIDQLQIEASSIGYGAARLGLRDRTYTQPPNSD